MRDLHRGNLGWYALAAVVIALVGFRLVGGQPPAAPVQVSGAPPAAAASPQGAQARDGGHTILVHVAGAVRRPGVYAVPASARAGDAVQAAGGPLRRADPAGVNLAAPLADGQQVVVPARVRGAPAGAAAAPAGGGAASAAPISLSTATLEQLDSLDGIGPAIAQRIVDYREAHGGFRSVDELREVEGIGDKRFEALRDAVRP